MTGAGEFLGRLVEALDGAGIPYMVAGSFASTYYGEPRTTHDIDMVVAPTARSLKVLLRALPEDDYYVSEEAALVALRDRGQFNVIDLETGWKVDLIVQKNRPFSRTELERRRPGRLLGVELMVASPEDVALTKLEWAKLSPSERQIRDVAGILRVSGSELDLDYLARWVEELQLSTQWKAAQAQVE